LQVDIKAQSDKWMKKYNDKLGFLGFKLSNQKEIEDF